MKNKKIYVSMLILTIIFLVAMYVLKIFFPQEFVMNITNPQLVTIGNFINNNVWAYYLFGIFTSFLTYWLYCCATCKKLYLNLKECLIILLTIVINMVLTHIDMDLYSHFSICSMLLLPLLFGGKLKETAIVFGVHGLSQILMLKIRNFPMYMVSVNSLCLFICNFEMYLWLFLFYLIFNIKKEN